MAADAWVINASPLILLGRIGQLELKSVLLKQGRVPEAVIAELEAGKSKDSTAESTIAWANNFRSTTLPCPESISNWELGAGETQVIATAQTHHARAVLDDRMARRCADVHHIRTIGTLGICLRARKLGLIQRVRPLLDQLRLNGLYFTDDLVNPTLAKLGE